MPSLSRTVHVAADASHVFHVLDDFTKTPTWLSRCVHIDELNSGPHHPGYRLRYHYRDGRRSGQMQGVIAARVAQRELRLRFEDNVSKTEIDFEIRPLADGGTELHYEVDIRPRGMGILFAPAMKRALPAQMDADINALVELINKD